MTRQKAELLLFTAIALRSTSYMFSSVLLDTLSPYGLMAVRFLIAFGLLAILFHKKITGIHRITILRGMILGGCFFATMSFETIGLQHTSSSTMAFLENTAIIFVPMFLAVLTRTLPAKSGMISALIALIGVGFLTLKNGQIALTQGELFGIGAAICYAMTIIATDRLTKEDDATLLGILQIGFIGIFSLTVSLFTGSFSLPATTPQWGMMFYLVLICTGLGFTLQPVAQKYSSAEKAGLFCAFNPLIASVLGVVFLREAFPITSAIGAGLILTSLIVSARAGSRENERSQVTRKCTAEFRSERRKPIATAQNRSVH